MPRGMAASSSGPYFYDGISCADPGASLHRVRRDELYDSSSGSESGNGSGGGSGSSRGDAEEVAEVRAKLNARLSSLLGLDLSVPEPPASEETTVEVAETTAHPQDGPLVDQEEHEEEFEFRLFSSSKDAISKVFLPDSDDEAEREGAFVKPLRPISHYFAGEPTAEQRERYRLAAVTYEDILREAKKRAWGLEVPWRVTEIKLKPKIAKTPRSSTVCSGATTTTTPTTTTAVPGEDISEKRKRPGKKRRIAMRIKAKAAKEKEEQKLTKEEHLKEKKKRLNREKKLKRRQKEKEKKLAGGGAGGPSVAADSGSDDDGP